MKKILLLDAGYQVQSFIDFKRAIKLLMNEKVEIISHWDDLITYGSGAFQLPSILKLHYFVKRKYFRSSFTRGSIIKRDASTCQYCNLKLSGAAITIDHVIPKIRGGANNYSNCVVACFTCNNSKGDRTPEEAGMALIKKPVDPAFHHVKNMPHLSETWHQDWNLYLISGIKTIQ